MTSIFRKLISPNIQKDNLSYVCQATLDHYNIKNTFLAINNFINDHSEYPSALTIIDCLSKYGIDSAAIRKGNYQIIDFEMPIICPIQESNWPQPYFTIVFEINVDTISYLNPINGFKQTMPISDFNKIDKDIVLLLDPNNIKHEVDFEKNKKKENLLRRAQIRPIIYYLSILTFAAAYAFCNFPPFFATVNTSLLILNSIGALGSFILILHDVDSHTPFLKEVCGTQKGTFNCDAVLKSKGATIFGINWSIIGFTYFFTVLFSQLLIGFGNSQYLYYWSLLSLIAILYIPYSLYYQWKVIRQWCPLCIIIQSVLFTSGLLSLSYAPLISTRIFPIYPTFILVSIALLIVSFLNKTKPLLKIAKQSKEYEKKWRRLRYNPDVFNILLQKETSVTWPTKELGILIGNPEAENEIIKVCNPYCGPCAKAHIELEELMRLNSNVKIRIIFTANGREDDIKTPPVRHLLTLQESQGDKIAHKALNDWYMSERKDYTTFAHKYPINGNMEQQGIKIDNMSKWCSMMKIRSTPTFYINGFELPDSYRISDLKNIL